MRWHRSPAVWLAWAVLLVALLLPLGAMLLRSVTFYEVELTSGRIHRAVGEVVITDEEHRYDLQGADEIEKRSWSELNEDVAAVHRVYSLDHYVRVFSDDRTLGLLRNSLKIGLGGALLAMLLGLPMAWILARVRVPWKLPRRLRLPAVLRPWIPGVHIWLLLACLTPAILPPFFIALGGARTMQGWLIAGFGLEGGALQVANSILVFGCVLFPLYVLLVTPAIRAVPAGPWEAARLLGGPRAAWRTVTRPAVLPAVAAAFVLAVVIALTDCAVPDVLGFMLPSGGTPVHVFATEILLQWKQNGNTARAVATSAPFVLVTVLLLFLAVALIRRSPALHTARGHRERSRVELGVPGSALAGLFLLAVLGVSLVLPLSGIASWAGDGAESISGGSENPSAAPTKGVGLFDFSTTLDRTVGSRKERNRWLWTALAAALLSMAVAAPLARVATRGGRLARTAVLTVGALPLAVPGLVLGAGTLLFWQSIPGDWVRPLEEGILRSTLVLTAKFLPFALVGAWLGLRAVRPGHEEAAAVLGTPAWARAWRIVLPGSWMGIAGGGVLVFLMALRELDTIVLVDARILPMRLYDKIHFNRMADEANLLFLCLAWFLCPALLGALIAGLWRHLRGEGPQRPESP